MENYQIEAALIELKGKKIKHKDKVQQLIRFEMKESIIKLVTDERDISILYADAEETLAGISVVESHLPTSTPMHQSVMASTGHSLAATLMDNIKKVQADPGYIPQAMEIKNQAEALISLAKTEIEYMKTMTSLRSYPGK